MDARIFNVHDIFLVITIFEVVILAAYRITVPTKAGAGNLWLVLFLVAVALDMFANLVMWNPEFPAAHWVKQEFLAYLFTFTHFVRGPLFLFYVTSLLFSRRFSRLELMAHAMPFVIALTAVGVLGVTSYDLQSRSDNTLANSIASAIWYISSVVSVIYALVALYVINRYMVQVKQRMSSVPVSEVTWLAVLSICFLVSWTWSFLVVLVADTVGGEVADATGTLHNLIRFLLMNGLVFYNLAYAWNLSLAEPADTAVAQTIPAADDVIKAIQKGIDHYQLHLQPSINIDQFADKVGMPPRVVSQVINRDLGTRFFEFINHHRVEHAKTLLTDPNCARMTILDILLASGFNNKSSFHRFFNRLVGCSPTEFRRAHLPQHGS
ncbi:helix-turn-helix domain-containing protein [Gilvimarinus sp. SDUM040013]|uniref:Helix-turn-helix domain-containing protein n=1 Tax=Gilvimarinus gilvus TaxID=3058038 RepID=A0ABU4RUS9_9GAMM|nr:helix-turn-helix domain-containing protein [Gilvimarinus sp. SDUM040013]MDO3388490.1 helix-turn-helix domain-containing protein [Gilvimarinus sp. SDUM040013]MDX6848638.1 helix-turn-helix domain-containing protein [Gilvimarinus sp. SDUM040013]